MTRSLRWLKDEIALRMMQKLEILKHQPQSLLILPDAIGSHGRLLAKRFPNARLSSILEPCSGMNAFALKVARASRFIKNGIPTFPTLRMDSLDIADQSQDMVFSNLWMQELDNPKWAIEEAWRVLREGGLITLSYLGPDTGKELRAMDPILLQGHALRHLPGAWDMHDLGDALVQMRFADPVMDMEYLTLEYESDDLYLEDAIALGLLKQNKVGGLKMKKSSLLPKKMTLEVVYGHAWVVNKNLSKTRDAVTFISPDQIKRKGS